MSGLVDLVRLLEISCIGSVIGMGVVGSVVYYKTFPKYQKPSMLQTLSKGYSPWIHLLLGKGWEAYSCSLNELVEEVEEQSERRLIAKDSTSKIEQ